MKGFKWTDEEKKNLSEKRKAYLKEQINLVEHELLFANKRKTLEERNKEKEQTRKKNKEKRNEEIEKRKEQILNSGVDLSKFGWVDKVSEITKLTRRQIARIVKLTDLKNFVYIRKMK